MTANGLAARSSQAARLLGMGMLLVVLAGCSGFNLFGPPKIREEEIIPPETLYTEALAAMDRQNYRTTIESLEKLERQHPYSQYSERAKLMTVYAHYRAGRYSDAVLAADRYLALYPTSKETAYILYLKGNSYFSQIKDITRDQQLSRDAIDTFTMIINGHGNSEYAAEAREKIVVATDQLAGKEMSVGRYYLGNGQYGAAINRFRAVVDTYQTSTHIEEALYRLTEANLALGLVNEAQTATAVLGHNYPSSSWYRQAFELLRKQGLSPQVNSGSTLAAAIQG